MHQIDGVVADHAGIEVALQLSTVVDARRATVARRVLRDYHPHEGNFPTEFLPYKREEARKKMQPVLDARPDLAAAAEVYRKHFERRR